MAYTAVTDIEGEFKSVTFGSATAVTLTQVNEFIAQEEAAIDAAVGAVYVTPVTVGSQAVAVMKLMSTLMVKARVLDKLYVKSADQKTDQGTPAEDLRKRVAEMLKQIQKKIMPLPGASLISSVGGVRSYTDDTQKDHIFQRDVDQW